MRIRVVDFVAEFIKEKLKVDDVFMISGGGAMFLNDGIAKHGNIRTVCNHHEQASSMGAVGYAKYTNGFGVVIPTTGCGGTNCVTGLLDAWQDNVKVFFISGNDNKSRTIHNSAIKLRQLGVQEADIISIVSSITKYSVMVNDAEEIAFHLEKAKYLAEVGRPGPVWIDLPLDIQGAFIESDELKHFSPSDLQTVYKTKASDHELEQFINDLSESKRPVVVAGNGIRLGNAVAEFRNFINKYKIPVVVTFLGVDLLPSEHPQFIGRTGSKGDRAGNFAMQNSDLLISFGSRFSVGSTGFDNESFAREAKIIAIDIDNEEHKKNTVKIDYVINADIKEFLIQIEAKLKNKKIPFNNRWVETCEDWKKKWPTFLEEYKDDKTGINLYFFLDILNRNLKEDSVVVSDAGSAYYVTSQSLMIKDAQRYITSGAQAEMGFTLPASIGVCVARNNKEVIGITGDGSFQMNVQELQTIVHNKFPVKLFIWNNNGYLSIRATQKRFFEGRLIGTDSSCGVSFPSAEKIACAYGIKFYRVSTSEEVETQLPKILSENEAVICEVICQSDQILAPIVTSIKNKEGHMISKPLEDMFPFLTRKEFKKNMIIKTKKE
jgi:acetolactate synthase I/II/III large subunit